MTTVGIAWRVCVCAAFAYTGLLGGPARANALSVFQEQVKTAGFEPVYPIAEGIEPGTLYSLIQGAGNLQVPDEICGAAFVTPIPPSKHVGLASIKANDTDDLKASLSVLPDLFKDLGSASADLGSAGVTKGTLSFVTPEITALPAVILPNGSKRQVSKPCVEALKTYFDPTTNKPTRDVFLVARTLSVGDLSYNVEVTRDHSGGLKLALEKLFKLDFSYKPTSDTTAEIVFKGSAADRRVIGVNRIKITDFKPDNIIGAARTSGASINGVAVPASDVPTVLPHSGHP